MSSISPVYFNKKCEEVNQADIQRLIDDIVTENYTLDYKALNKNPKYGTFGKVISSFLNTNGGLLIIGVSEKKHKYPDKITWGAISRETLVQNLYNIVDPWSSDIKIKTIENVEEENERIFVIDVPKSKSPPHMANGVYFFRNVYESIPMTHSQVKGILTESYLAKEKIIENIIGPLFNTLKTFHEKIQLNYYCDEDTFDDINKKYRFLLFQMNDIVFIENFDDYFQLLKKRNYLVSRYESIIRNVIKKTVKENLRLINESFSSNVSPINIIAVDQQAVTIQYQREVLTDNLSHQVETSSLIESLFFDILPREEILNRKHVKELKPSYKIIILPNDQSNKREINSVSFPEIYGVLLENVKNTLEISMIKQYTEDLREKTREMIELCLEKI